MSTLEEELFSMQTCFSPVIIHGVYKSDSEVTIHIWSGESPSSYLQKSPLLHIIRAVVSVLGSRAGSQISLLQVSALLPNLWRRVSSPAPPCLASTDVALWAHLLSISKRAEEPLHHQHLKQRSKFGRERDKWLLQEAFEPTALMKCFPEDQSKDRIYSSWFSSCLSW